MIDFAFTLSVVDFYFAFTIANLFTLPILAFSVADLFYSLADLLLIGFPFFFVADLSLIEFLSID